MVFNLQFLKDYIPPHQVILVTDSVTLKHHYLGMLQNLEKDNKNVRLCLNTPIYAIHPRQVVREVNSYKVVANNVLVLSLDPDYID